MRILLTGAGGQLGTDIQLAAARRPEVELHPYDRSSLDITDATQTLDVIGSVDPDVIIHAAAYTAVDDCETNDRHAYAVNVTGTNTVASGALNTGAKLIFVSTDYVFDGTKVGPYVEADRPKPASVYGRSKMLAENIVRGGAPDRWAVVRTSWVCGAHGSNMVKTILRVAESHDVLTFVDDQVGKPTFTTDLADVLLDVSLGDQTGIMHVTNEGAVSWYDFCREVMIAAGLDPERVRPCATSELQPPRPAPRPANSVLANTRSDEIDLPLLRDFREPLREVVRDLTS